MTIDMSQFYQVFFDETDEHLSEMESLLLELDVDRPDLEKLNAIFRAAHSIKGGAGTFGFTDMARVTHVLETLLDRLRKQELKPAVEMVDAFLEAGDVLKAQLEAHREGGEYQDERIEQVCHHLEALTAGENPPETDAPAGALDTDHPASSGEDAPAGTGWRIHFDPVAAGIAESDTLNALADGIAELGRLQRVDEATGRPYLWVLTTDGPLAAERILEVFDFICDTQHIQMEPLPASGESAAADPGFGLFDAAPGVPGDTDADPGYGLFEDAPGGGGEAGSGMAPDAVAQEAGYGFFTEAPGSPGSSGEIQEGEGYGLFSDAPGSEQVRARDEQDRAEAARGYGLFDPSPGYPEGAREGEGGTGAKASGGDGVKGNGTASAGAGKTPPPPDGQERRQGSGGPPRKPGGGDSSIRVSVEKVDQLINLVGELVITHAMLAESASRLDPVAHENIFNGLSNLERNSRDLQQAVMSIRMMPISFVFNRFPRVVRDTAANLKKKVSLKLVGEETELDKGLIERLADPLNHLVRNSIDHGIESPEKRRAAGKSETGEITLRASHQGGNIVVEVADDGGGLNREKLLAKAAERGVPVSENPSDKEVWQLIFAPGFSTADQVTDISGRGVGMDVVRRNIEQMNGRVDIDSAPGQGTRITIRLPLTLAILDGMSVRLGEEIFILPLTAIRESIQPRPEQLKTVSGQGRVLQVGDEYLPLIHLQEVFDLGTPPQRIEDSIIVLVDTGQGRAALVVEELLAQQQVVIKSLETNYRKVEGVSGATILGDGRVALILDVDELLRLSQRTVRPRLSTTARGDTA
ncbi:CheA signal transduction histidine kinase [Ectothiorhodospira mobilis]|uniref:Chemotaxis protein CheA n=1 Tax=Ectothiorhodospira mobilis TaxID=195064 RepID=A0A1I4PT33_ECTMO|nr:chemotaxis protein CheW [Ectothiorhodospira mobilis]SFM30914.1 CheA signal transduction histidine kinase [Ectothiorhodospira mobilis]